MYITYKTLVNPRKIVIAYRAQQYCLKNAFRKKRVRTNMNSVERFVNFELKFWKYMVKICLKICPFLFTRTIYNHRKIHPLSRPRQRCPKTIKLCTSPTATNRFGPFQKVVSSTDLCLARNHSLEFLCSSKKQN